MVLRYLGVNEVAEALHISRQSVYALFKRQDFPCVRLGHRLLVSETALENWLSSGATGGERITGTK